MKKILVVGGAGYIGGSVTDLLMNKNYSFSVYDSLLYEEQYRKSVPFIRGDIRDTDKLKSIISGYDAVIWLAALVGDGACSINPSLTKEINQDTVEWLSKNYDGRICFLSTCSVYGRGDGILKEDSDKEPLSVYAKTKLVAESYLYNKNAITFRLGTVFGVSDQFSRMRMDLVLNIMTLNAITKGQISVFGGEQWRPLIHVKDVARAVVSGVESEKVGIFNIHHENTTMKNLGDMVVSATGAEITYGDMMVQDMRNYRVSSEKVLKEIGFKTTYSIDYGISEVKDLIQSGRIVDPYTELYHNEKFLKSFRHRLI
jgi:nucleoside-diphosphate-sugar epimerase